MAVITVNRLHTFWKFSQKYIWIVKAYNIGTDIKKLKELSAYINNLIGPIIYRLRLKTTICEKCACIHILHIISKIMIIYSYHSNHNFVFIN